MAYNTKEIIRDKNDNPISQYYNETTDSYEPVKGGGGGNAVTLYNVDGTENNELSLIPILDRLSQLTGTVIDEETRKSNEILREDNEITRVSLYDDLLIQLNRIEQITEQVPQSILDELTVILGKLGGLESLTTTEKANLVGAINEVKQQSNDIETIELPKKANKKQENYHIPTTMNGWVDFGPTYPTVSYYKDDFERVHINGMIKSGVLDKDLFVLPTGYRPLKEMYFLVNAKDGVGTIVVSSNGVVKMGPNTSSEWTSINGISFRAGV